MPPVPPNAWCHACTMEILPLTRDGEYVCPRCEGSFVELVEADEGEGSGSSPPMPAGSWPADDVDDFPGGSNDPYAYAARNAHEAEHAGGSYNYGGANAIGGASALGGFFSDLINLATGQPTHGNAQQGAEPGSSTSGNSGRVEHGRDGTVSWSYSTTWGTQWPPQQGQGSRTQGQDPSTNAEARARGEVPTLASFLNNAFAGSAVPHAPTTANRDTHVHDDGMGGAGAAADGRFFNHDNTEAPSTQREPHFIGRPFGQQARNTGQQAESTQDTGLPPEIAHLRNLFTNVLGGSPNATESGSRTQRSIPGSLIDMIFGGASSFGNNGSFSLGDFDLGGRMDDLITRLMQESGGNAPAPARPDAIKGLKRWNKSDKERNATAKNQDCPICMAEFEDSPPQSDPADAAQAAAAAAAIGEPVHVPAPGDDTDDPPETLPTDVNSDDLDENTLALMPCGHLFHESCIVPWLRLNGTCPVCRTALSTGEESSASASATTSNAGAATTTTSVATSATSQAEMQREPSQPSQEERGLEWHPLLPDADEDTEMEDSPEVRRERMRRAAERRVGSLSSGDPAQSGRVSTESHVPDRTRDGSTSLLAPTSDDVVNDLD